MSQEPYGKVPSWVLQDPDISPPAKALFALLCTYADKHGRCWPSNLTLARCLGSTPRAIQKWLAQLSRSGAIVREQRHLANRETTSITRIQAIRGERAFIPLGEPVFVQNKTTMNLTNNPSTDSSSTGRFNRRYPTDEELDSFVGTVEEFNDLFFGRTNP